MPLPQSLVGFIGANWGTGGDVWMVSDRACLELGVVAS